MGNKGQVQIIAGILILLVIGVGTFYFIDRSNAQKTITANAIANLENQLDEQGQLTIDQKRELEELKQVTCRDVQVPYDDLEYYTEQEPYIDTVCENEYLVKSIENFDYLGDTCLQEEEECIDYFLGVCTNKKTYCVKKTASCSLDLRNLDSQEGGTWKIKFDIKDSSKTIIKSSEVSEYLYPQTTETIYGEITITSEGENGQANIPLNWCGYTVLENPEKTVCEDVTKYKTVTKSRTITKYKTETVCE